MFILNCTIKFEKDDGKTATLKHTGGVSVVTSVNTLTDTCQLMLQKKLGKDSSSNKALFQRGDKVTVELGYDDKLEKVFTGFIKDVTLSDKLVLDCENEAWLLKQIKLPASHEPNFNLKNFADTHLTRFNPKVFSMDMGEVRINADTPVSKLLEQFMKSAPLRFFFREGVFYGGLNETFMQAENVVKTHKFIANRNIISKSLTYTKAEDVKIQVVAKAVLKNNKVLECKEPSDGEGEIRTFLCPNITSEDKLKAFAKDTLAGFKVDKITGNIVAFGRPFVRKGDIVHLFDDEAEDYNDKKFFVTAVTYSFGTAGYRQTITLGNRIN